MQIGARDWSQARGGGSTGLWCHLLEWVRVLVSAVGGSSLDLGRAPQILDLEPKFTPVPVV